MWSLTLPIITIVAHLLCTGRSLWWRRAWPWPHAPESWAVPACLGPRLRKTGGAYRRMTCLEGGLPSSVVGGPAPGRGGTCIFHDLENNQSLSVTKFTSSIQLTRKTTSNWDLFTLPINMWIYIFLSKKNKLKIEWKKNKNVENRFHINRQALKQCREWFLLDEWMRSSI